MPLLPSAVSVPLAGQVLVHQRLDVPEANVADTPVTSLLPDPPQVRPDRHPLLGIGESATGEERCFPYAHGRRP